MIEEQTAESLRKSYKEMTSAINDALFKFSKETKCDVTSVGVRRFHRDNPYEVQVTIIPGNWDAEIKLMA